MLLVYYSAAILYNLGGLAGDTAERGGKLPRSGNQSWPLRYECGRLSLLSSLDKRLNT